MRKIFQALLILVAVLACATGTASAKTSSVRTLNPHLLSARVGWVGQLDATTPAYGDRHAGSTAEVLADGTSTPPAVAAPAAPNGCSGAAAGAGRLLFVCALASTNEGESRRAVVTAPDGTVETSLDYRLPTAGADGSPPGLPDAIGSEWIHHESSCYHCGMWSQDLNWHTGEIRTPDLRATPATFEDLDAQDLITPLCAPLKQNQAPIDEGSWPLTLGVQISGRWVLQGVAAKSADGVLYPGWRLRHCGTTKVYKMPKGTSPVALAGGFVVLLQPKSKVDERASIELLRLRDRRVFRVGGTWNGYDLGERFAATAHRLLILGDADSAGSLWSVMLPQK